MRVALWIALAACGNDLTPIDLPDVALDAEVVTDTPIPPTGCDWAELDDPLNDITLGNGVAEATNLTLGEALAICGAIDNGHFLNDTVDVDGYTITIAARTEVRVDLAGDASMLAGLEVRVIDDANAELERASYLGNHAVLVTTLPAGNYRIVVVATNPSDLAARLDYQVKVIANPVGCARVTAAAVVTEAADGAQHVGNDMIEIRYAAGARTLTTNNDTPEPAGSITAAVRITGTSANVDGGDDFHDRDTYLIETPDNELALRVDWTGDADFDVFVFPEGTVVEIGRGTSVGKTAPERAVFPVLPNTRYWVWIGSYESSAGLPVDYDLSLCPSQF